MFANVRIPDAYAGTGITIHVEKTERGLVHRRQ